MAIDTDKLEAVHEAYEATPAATLEEYVMSPNIPKSEAMWWAQREITRLTEERDALATDLTRANEIIAEKEARVADAHRALRSIAEGDLGDAPWQANYETIRQVARNALKEPSQ